MSDGSHFADFPPWDQMNFARNCTLWGNWLAAFLLPNPWQPNIGLLGGYRLGLELFAVSVPEDFDFWPNLTIAEKGAKISSWYGWNIFNTFIGNGTFGYFNWTAEFQSHLLENPSIDCPVEACKAMGYLGNTDMIGIGVYASYFVEASLATLYLFTFTIWGIRQRRRAGKLKRSEAFPKQTYEDVDSNTALPTKPTLGQRSIDSFRGTLATFLTTALLISLVSLSAALKTAISRQGARWGNFGNQILPFYDSAWYDIILSLLAASFSVFPVLLLYALMGQRKRRTSKRDNHRLWLRRGVLLLMWVLAMAEVYLAPRAELDYDQRHDPNQQANIDPCYHRGGTRYWQSIKAAQVLVVGVPLLWLLLTGFVLTGFWIPGVVDRSWVRKWRSVWRMAVAWINMLLMWGLLVYFTILRSNIIETADGLDKGNKWTFGQFLALATWAPIVVEFFYIFIWGLEESFNTQMPPDFSVVHRGSDFSSTTAQFHRPRRDGEALMSRDASSDAPARQMEIIPMHTEYQPKVVTPQLHTTGISRQYQAPIDYDHARSWHSQSAWHEWNRTGW